MTRSSKSNNAPDKDKGCFSTSYRVIYGDTDRAGVVYYATYLRLFEIGRTEYMRHVTGTPYRELEEGGILFPVVEAYVRYKSPATYDDMLDIETEIQNFSRYSITFSYKITCSGRTVVHGHTKHASTDRTGKLTKLPQGLIEAIG